MIEVLSKSVDQIGIRDVESFIASEVPEGEQIEFKEELQAKGDGSPNPWMEGKNKIGDRAGNEILEEVVAFANAHSGALLLGIRESNTKPSVATSISPIPRCAELAERLKLVFRDCVEPQLPRIEIFAVPTEGESGVVIVRAGRSRLAPHRGYENTRLPSPPLRPMRENDHARNPRHDIERGAGTRATGTATLATIRVLSKGVPKISKILKLHTASDSLLLQ